MQVSSESHQCRLRHIHRMLSRVWKQLNLWFSRNHLWFPPCCRTQAGAYILKQKHKIVIPQNHKICVLTSERCTRPQFPVKPYIIYIRCNRRVPKNTNLADIVPGARCLKGSATIRMVRFAFISCHVFCISLHHCVHIMYLFMNLHCLILSMPFIHCCAPPLRHHSLSYSVCSCFSFITSHVASWRRVISFVRSTHCVSLVPFVPCRHVISCVHWAHSVLLVAFDNAPSS